MKSFVTISKKWGHPQINITMDQEGIALKMDIEDFKIALKQEIGSVTWVLKKETLDLRLDEAINRIISGVKEESAKVV